MRPLSTLALTFALSLAAGTAFAQQRQGGQPQDTQRMDHSNMQGMDHSKMDRSKMQGMDHSNMPGMDHSRTNAQGGQARQPAQQGAQQRRSN